MTTGRINQVTIPQGTRREPFGLRFLSKDAAILHAICTGVPGGQATRTGRRNTALSLPRLHTASPLQASGIPVPLPSARNAKKMHRGRTLLRNLSLYSWPRAITYNIHPFSLCLGRDNLATIGSFLAIQQASLLNIAPVCSICHHFVPRNIAPSRAYSYGPNTAQALLQSLPTPALT